MPNRKDSEKLWVFTKYLFQGFMGFFYISVGIFSYVASKPLFGLTPPFDLILGTLFLIYGSYRCYRVYIEYKES